MAGPVTMLFFCLCGMAIGLAIDCGTTPPEILAGLCAAASESFSATFVAHWQLFPATHIMMLAGALVAIGLTASSDWAAVGPRGGTVVRLAGDALCVGAMFAGMAVGAWVGPLVASGLGLPADFTLLTASMAAGMAFGMLCAMPLYRRPSGRTIGR